MADPIERIAAALWDEDERATREGVVCDMTWPVRPWSWATGTVREPYLLRAQAVIDALRMPRERALEIAGACVWHVAAQMGIGRSTPLPSLEEYSLAELAEAQAVVRDVMEDRDTEGRRVLHTYCDDRLVAALYLAVHGSAYDPKEASATAVVGDVAVVVVRLPRDASTENAGAAA